MAAAAAATPATAEPGWSTRLLGKPHNFSGKDEDWASWAVVRWAYVGAIDVGMLDEMRACEQLGEAIDSELNRVEQQQQWGQVYFILAMLCEGRAEDKVANVQWGHGLEL